MFPFTVSGILFPKFDDAPKLIPLVTVYVLPLVVACAFVVDEATEFEKLLLDETAVEESFLSIFTLVHFSF